MQSPFGEKTTQNVPVGRLSPKGDCGRKRGTPVYNCTHMPGSRLPGTSLGYIRSVQTKGFDKVKAYNRAQAKRCLKRNVRSNYFPMPIMSPCALVPSDPSTARGTPQVRRYALDTNSSWSLEGYQAVYISRLARCCGSGAARVKAEGRLKK